MLRLLRLFSGLLIPDGGLRRLHPLPRLSRLSSFSATSANGLEVSHLHQARSLAAMVAIVAFSLSAFCRPRFSTAVDWAVVTTAKMTGGP